MILCIVYLLRIFKMFHGLMKNPVQATCPHILTVYLHYPISSQKCSLVFIFDAWFFRFSAHLIITK